MYLPVVIPPHEDELLYSYILRLAEANGFDDITLFLKFYVNDQRGMKTPTIKYNSEEPLNGLVKYLHPVLNPDGSETDFLNFYLDHSMAVFYHTYGWSHTTNQIICQQFVPSSESYSSQRYFCRNRPPLNFCPKCMSEDKAKYGRPYIHRIHQVPYAQICPVHNCGLLYYTGMPGRELPDPVLKETPLKTNRHTQVYTEMCDELFKINHSLDHQFNSWKTIHGYYGWEKFMRFEERLLYDWIEPYKSQCMTPGHTKPRSDTTILYLLFCYIEHKQNLSETLSTMTSEIPMIQEKIRQAAVC